MDGVEDIIKDEVQKYMTGSGMMDDITSIVDDRIDENVGNINTDEILGLFS